MVTNKINSTNKSSPVAELPFENLRDVYISSSPYMMIRVFVDYLVESEMPVNLPVGSPIYVKLSIENNKLLDGGKFKIFAEECVGIPSLESSNQIDKHFIIKNQCP